MILMMNGGKNNRYYFSMLLYLCSAELTDTVQKQMHPLKTFVILRNTLHF